MRKFIFILGGARSGKSRYAVELAKKLSRKVVFIATAEPFDEEMKKRIKKHKSSRPRYWELIEESRNISPVLRKLNSRFEVVIVDCMGLLVSNLLEDSLKDNEIKKKIKVLFDAIGGAEPAVILVSNEAGMGVVPDNPLARRFRDLLGLINQMAAERADDVFFMQAGIPVCIKGGRSGHIK